MTATRAPDPRGHSQRTLQRHRSSRPRRRDAASRSPGSAAESEMTSTGGARRDPRVAPRHPRPVMPPPPAAAAHRLSRACPQSDRDARRQTSPKRTHPWSDQPRRRDPHQRYRATAPDRRHVAASPRAPAGHGLLPGPADPVPRCAHQATHRRPSATPCARP